MKGRVWIKKSSIHLVKVSGVEKNTTMSILEGTMAKPFQNWPKLRTCFRPGLLNKFITKFVLPL